MSQESSLNVRLLRSEAIRPADWDVEIVLDRRASPETCSLETKLWYWRFTVRSGAPAHQAVLIMSDRYPQSPAHWAHLGGLETDVACPANVWGVWDRIHMVMLILGMTNRRGVGYRPGEPCDNEWLDAAHAALQSWHQMME